MAKKLWIENIENPSAAFQEDSPEGDWLDKTTDAESWDSHGKKVMDYLFYRDKISSILFIRANPNYPTIDFSGWQSGLSDAERLLMAKYILAPYQLRLTQFSDSEDESNWFTLLRITQGTESFDKPFTGRSYLIEKMRKHVANKVRVEELTMSQTQAFFKDVYVFVLWYIAAAIPDFKLWLTNAEGSAYENDGFEEKEYWSQALEDGLMDIYENG